MANSEKSGMTRKEFVIGATAAGILAAAGVAPTEALAQEAKFALPPTNPLLMPNSFYPMVHWDPAATDTTTESAWVGDHQVKSGQVKWIPMPPSSIGTAQYPILVAKAL